MLWLAVKALAALHESSASTRPLHVVIYAGAEDAAVGGPAILAKAQQHFGVQLRGKDDATLPISFVFVRGRPWLEAQRYPVFTMLGQSLGSVLFAAACLCAFCPDVFLDTTGCAFTYPLASLAGRCRVAAYVHYPTISTDMLSLVREQRPSYNNDAAVAGSGWRSRAKLLYVNEWPPFPCHDDISEAHPNSIPPIPITQVLPPLRAALRPLRQLRRPGHGQLLLDARPHPGPLALPRAPRPHGLPTL